jgi:hypothetical protein
MKQVATRSSSPTRRFSRRACRVAAAATAGLLLAGLQPTLVSASPRWQGEVRPVNLGERSAKELLPGADMRADKLPVDAPIVKGLHVTNATGVRTRINGLDLRDQRLANNGNSFSVEPPDQALCVGQNYLIEGVNDVFAVWNTDGHKVSGNRSYAPFFTGRAEVKRDADGNIVRYGPFVSDPKCYYDPALKRFFMTMLQLGVNPKSGDFTGASFVDIAVSKDSRPTTSRSDWFQYHINVANAGGPDATVPTHPGCPCLGDQPLIGADRYGFYITTNEFPLFQPGFNGAQLYAMDKAALARGTLRLQRLESVNRPLAEGVAYSVQPATSPTASEWSDAANGTEFFLSALEFTGGYDNRIATWAMTNTKSLTTATPDVHLSVKVTPSETYGAPPPARQRQGPHPLGQVLKDKLNKLDTNDDRMNQVVYADGRLWSGLNTGVRQEAGLSPHPGIAYFVVSPSITDTGGVAAAMDHQGYVAVANAAVMFPAIGVTSSGRAVMVFSMSGEHYYPSAAQVHLGTSGALTSDVQIVQAGRKPADGFTGYPEFGGKGIERWGDYSAAVADPAGRVWVATEYIPGTFGYPPYIANWGTYVAGVTP